VSEKGAVTRIIDRWLAHLLPRWVGAVQKRSGAVLIATLVLTAGAAVYTASHLEINTDEDSLFDETLPHRIVELEYKRVFPNLYENIVIVVDGQNAEQARDAAALLADRLAATPDLFSGVYLPQSEFLEEHALLYMKTDELEDLADRLARVQPYLATLAEDGSLRGLSMMLARGVHALREGDVSGENLFPMLEKVDSALRASIENRSYHLSWAEVVAGRPLDQERKRRLILAQPIRDFTAVVAAAKPLSAVRGFARELGLTEENGIRVRMTGDVALAYEEMGLVEDQARAAGIASFILVAGLLYLALRSVRLVFATLFSLVVGLIWTSFFAALAIGHLNLLSIAFGVLFIGLGVDFGVHLCMGYQELLGRGRTHADAMREAAGTVGSSLALCAVTTAIGFYVFIPTDFSGVAELGLISGTGMFVSMFCSFTVLPAIFSLWLREESARRAATRARVKLIPSFPIRHPLAVCVLTVIVAASAALLIPQIRFDQNPLLVRDPSAESVQTFEELLAQSSTSPWSANALRPDLESAEQLAAELRLLPVVDSAHTVSSYVPTDQREKLSIIEDVGLFLAPRPRPDGAPRAATPEESLAALRDFQRELEKLLRQSANQLPGVVADVRDSLVVYLDAIGSSDDAAKAAASLALLESSVVATLPEQLRSIERAVAIGPVTLGNLPDGLVDRMISASGMVRVRIFPSEDLTDADALERFVEQVREVAPRATGSAVSIYSATREVVQSLQQAFSLAVLAIGLLLFVIWRALGDTLLVMAPLALAGLLTAAGAVLAGIPFNFADVIVLPLLLGIGVDSSIHLVHRARSGSGAAGNLLETSTANAVVFSAATTVASFGSLAFATHRGMASLGQLLTLGVVMTVLCNLIVLPALLELRERRARRDGSGGALSRQRAAA
jgi:hopanoid biosynthesis associated RND transporter like protein HpnN